MKGLEKENLQKHMLSVFNETEGMRRYYCQLINLLYRTIVIVVNNDLKILEKNPFELSLWIYDK